MDALVMNVAYVVHHTRHRHSHSHHHCRRRQHHNHNNRLLPISASSHLVARGWATGGSYLLQLNHSTVFEMPRPAT